MARFDQRAVQTSNLGWTRRKRLDGWKPLEYWLCPTVQPRPTFLPVTRMGARTRIRARVMHDLIRWTRLDGGRQ